MLEPSDGASDGLDRPAGVAGGERESGSDSLAGQLLQFGEELLHWLLLELVEGDVLRGRRASASHRHVKHTAGSRADMSRPVPPRVSITLINHALLRQPSFATGENQHGSTTADRAPCGVS